ncbi:MAG: threonylcarbamoyl-AMP synthase [Parvularculaceae bacterium]|jgi:L-threonylcarbamoyladenylate synthase|nr:threonylcarbamoyl-AMP synthase [Parvularculaceae bacterium]
MAVLDWKDIGEAAEVIRRGGLVAIPTETVYGLAADATSDTAVARIFEVKRRPQFNPLIVHILDATAAAVHAEIPPLAQRLMDAFWPGPLTLVLLRRKESPLSLLATAGLDTVAMRAPDHPLARALLGACRRPLAAPSANRSGAVSPTRAEHVRESLGTSVDLILDGGPCPVGLESTIVKITGDEILLLRPGGVPASRIESVAGRILRRADSGAVEAPGMLVSHYAPRARLRLDARAPAPQEAFLAFGPAPPNHPYTFNLSETGSLREAAANLFAQLRAADALVATAGLSGIAAAPVPAEGLGEAINDRLQRAAAPR